MTINLTPEELCVWIERQLRGNGNFVATIANSALYLTCGRTSDAHAYVAELVEPIVRLALADAMEENAALKAKLKLYEECADAPLMKTVMEQRDALKAKLEEARAACCWSEDDDGNWNTGCGRMFVLNDGTPRENEMPYCCFCGRALDEERQVSPAVREAWEGKP